MHRYIKFYKPYGVVSTFTDQEGHNTLSKYIQGPGIYSAGRLDLDSEGLLILTNDGDLIHKLTDPRYRHKKTYYVQIEGIIHGEAIRQLEIGVDLKGYRSLPATVQMINEPELPKRGKPITPHKKTSWLKIDLEEGKKHQIRHMTAAVGFPTLRIVRIAIGPVSIDPLQPGDWSDLNYHEVNQLKKFITQ